MHGGPWVSLEPRLREGVDGGPLYIRRPEVAAVEFRILGPIEVSDGGHVVEVRPPKLRALLAMILVHANEVVSSERLVEGLWGEVPPASATNTLQSYVSQLRDLVEPGRRGAASRLLHTRPSG